MTGLALCYDGPQLVPIPNYFQPVETIVTNLTRALIWKYQCLDFSLIGMINRTGSELLPSWAHDWLNGHILLKAYGLTDWTTKRTKRHFAWAIR